MTGIDGVLRPIGTHVDAPESFPFHAWLLCRTSTNAIVVVNIKVQNYRQIEVMYFRKYPLGEVVVTPRLSVRVPAEKPIRLEHRGWILPVPSAAPTKISVRRAVPHILSVTRFQAFTTAVFKEARQVWPEFGDDGLLKNNYGSQIEDIFGSVDGGSNFNSCDDISAKNWWEGLPVLRFTLSGNSLVHSSLDGLPQPNGG